MKIRLIAGLGVVAFAAFTGAASAKGCLTGAAAGGVVGHVAGHHAVLGAAAGCAINHHRNAVNDRKASAAQSRNLPPPTPAPQPTVAPPPR